VQSVREVYYQYRSSPGNRTRVCGAGRNPGSAPPEIPFRCQEAIPLEPCLFDHCWLIVPTYCFGGIFRVT